MTRYRTVLLLLIVLLVVLVPCGMLLGSVSIPAAQVWGALTGDSSVGEVVRIIVLETRLPSVVASLLAGMALSVAGLLMQTTFSNPLAGPSIMGISAGSSLGVALVMLALGGSLGALGRLATIGGAFAGAVAVMGVLLVFSNLVRSSDVLLIVGILIGYLASSAISLLNFFASSEGVHSYVIWGLGSFSGVTSDALPLFAALALGLTVLSVFFAKPLNAMLLGQRYASNVGVSVSRVRTWLILLSGALTAVVTAWCGPIGFIGLAMPHVARMLIRSSNHTRLIPASALCGALAGLLCQILSVAPAMDRGVLPVNAITPLLGVPVIIYVLLNRRKLAYFN